MATPYRFQAEGFVLAGGHSSRMGSNKALASWSGIPLVRLALDTLSRIGVPARIAGARADLRKFAEQVPDLFEETGPIGGVHAGLTASHAEWSLFLPVDLPLIPQELLALLLLRSELSGSPVTVVRMNGRIQPFPVVLHASALSGLTDSIGQGETACHRIWHAISEALGVPMDAVSVEHLIQAGQVQHPSGLPASTWFQSANTPEDLTLLNRMRTRFPESWP
jgi:molybdopterin-guanine dinucleotide biosynthesis protein A